MIHRQSWIRIFFSWKINFPTFFYYFPLDNFPFSNKLKVDEFQFKNEYLVISWFSPGTEGRLSGPMDQVSGFESEVSRLDSHLGSWVAVWHTAISVANGYLHPIYQPTQKKRKKRYKKNRIFFIKKCSNLERKINFAKIRWFGFSFRGALFSRGVGRGLGWISHSLFWVNSDVMKPGMTHNTILEEYMTNIFEPAYSTCLFDHRQNIQLFFQQIYFKLSN